MKKEINKNMTIGEVLAIDENLADVFIGFDMHCLYCPMSRMETLEEASSVHGVDVDFLVKKLNESLNFSVEGALKNKIKVKKAKVEKI